MSQAPTPQNTPTETAQRRRDPEFGVFETLLVHAGEPVEVDAHLRRLGASLRTLWDKDLPSCARELIAERAAPLMLGRLRLTVTPTPAGLVCDAAAQTMNPAICFPGRERGARLLSLPFAGGLGPHKWTDRSALPASDDGTGPLLVDADGDVLEAGWANIFVAEAGRLSTPPLDGRVLPGTTRAAVIELALAAGIEVRDRSLRREDLLAADEAFLTSSLRGLEPVNSVDGVALTVKSDLGPQLATALRRRWDLDADLALSAQAA